MPLSPCPFWLISVPSFPLLSNILCGFLFAYRYFPVVSVTWNIEAATVLKIHVFHVSWYMVTNILKDLNSLIWKYLQGTCQNIPEDLNVATQL